MKIVVDLTETQLADITEWLAYQDAYDTKEIINKYKIDLDFEETDEALTKLYNQLSDAKER